MFPAIFDLDKTLIRVINILILWPSTKNLKKPRVVILNSDDDLLKKALAKKKKNEFFFFNRTRNYVAKPQ